MENVQISSNLCSDIRPINWPQTKLYVSIKFIQIRHTISSKITAIHNVHLHKKDQTHVQFSYISKIS